MVDGGQGGCAVRLSLQSDDLSNPVGLSVGKIDKTGVEANRILDVAVWLSRHRSELPDPIIPAVRIRFDLSNLEAVKALQLGHELAYPRV